MAARSDFNVVPPPSTCAQTAKSRPKKVDVLNVLVGFCTTNRAGISHHCSTPVGIAVLDAKHVLLLTCVERANVTACVDPLEVLVRVNLNLDATWGISRRQELSPRVVGLCASRPLGYVPRADFDFARAILAVVQDAVHHLEIHRAIGFDLVRLLLDRVVIQQARNHNVVGDRHDLGGVSVIVYLWVVPIWMTTQVFYDEVGKFNEHHHYFAIDSAGVHVAVSTKGLHY